MASASPCCPPTSLGWLVLRGVGSRGRGGPLGAEQKPTGLHHFQTLPHSTHGLPPPPRPEQTPPSLKECPIVSPITLDRRTCWVWLGLRKISVFCFVFRSFHFIFFSILCQRPAVQNVPLSVCYPSLISELAVKESSFAFLPSDTLLVSLSWRSMQCVTTEQSRYQASTWLTEQQYSTNPFPCSHRRAVRQGCYSFPQLFMHVRTCPQSTAISTYVMQLLVFNTTKAYFICVSLYYFFVLPKLLLNTGVLQITH